MKKEPEHLYQKEKKAFHSYQDSDKTALTFELAAGTCKIKLLNWLAIMLLR